MARSVTGLFEHQVQVASVVGALRDAGIPTDRISVVNPDDPAPGGEAATAPAHSGVGTWLVDHLVHRGVSHAHAQRYQKEVAEGRRLVTVTVITDGEDADARNLMVTAGADEISSAQDGHMIPISRPDDGVQR
jgi:hypothetical protein